MKLSINQKILGLAVIVTLAVPLVGFISIKKSNEVAEVYSEISDHALPATKTMGQLLFKLRQIRISVRSIPIQGNTPEMINSFIRESEAGVGEFEKELADAKFLFKTPELKSDYDKIVKNWENFRSFGGEVLTLAKKGDPESIKKVADLVTRVCPEKTRDLENELFASTNSFSEDAKVDVKEAKDSSNSAVWVIMILSVCLSVFSLVLAWIISSRLSGDLEIMTGKMGGSSKVLGNIVSEVEQASQSLSEASEQQSKAVQETASAIDEISAMVSKSAELSLEAEQASVNSSREAEKGKNIVDRLKESMEFIQTTNQQSAREMSESNVQVEKILHVIQSVSEKTKVINDIVFQTKLLSFNASVEAARAGEHGKGFSVVAEEVGNLANMSGNAALEINNLLSASTKEVEAIVEQTKSRLQRMVQSSSKAIEEGTSVANHCHLALQSIVDSSKEVSGMVGQITQGSQECAKGITGISNSLRQIDSASRITAKSAENCLKSSQLLSQESDELQEIAVTLDSAVKGAKAA